MKSDVIFSHLSLRSNRNHHFLVHSHIPKAVTEFTVRYFPITVPVEGVDGFVDNLLELYVSEVVCNHELQHREQLAVCYEAVLVHVVHLEDELQLSLSVPGLCERGNTWKRRIFSS